MLELIYAQSDTSHPVGFEYIVEDYNDWWLFSLTTTPVYYMIDGKKVVMPANTAMIYPPLSTINYGAIEGEVFGDHWLRFRTDEPFIVDGAVPVKTPFQVFEYMFIRDLINMLSTENFYQNHFKEFTIHSLFQILFYKLQESLSSKKADHRELALEQLHMNIQTNPSLPWNVPDMAKQLYISPRHLQKQYLKRYGVSCMEDVISHRLILAKELMVTTDLPLYKIAEQCGYCNTEHFSRQFKTRLGCSPKQYRLSLKENDA